MQATLTNVSNNSLFNAERKLEFLTDMIESGAIKEKTSTSYLRIFSTSKQDKGTIKIEKELNKDLSEFTLEEMEKVFYNFDANNRNTLESYGRIISSYLNWNVKKGYITTNVLSGFKPTDFEKYLTNDEVYLTEAELRRLEDRCDNYQDAVIPRLLFEGLSGKELSEIRNLKKKDVIAERNALIMRNEETNSETTFYVSERTIYLLLKAIEEKTYRKKNGVMEQTQYNNVREYTDLVDNDYVIRASITKTENFHKPVNKFVIYRRIDLLSGVWGIEDLTAKFIQRSGMIHFAHEKMKDHGELTLADLKNIAERFGVSSYHNLKGFLTMENVEKVYGRG